MRNNSSTFLPFFCLLLIASLLSCSSSKPISTVNQTGESPESAIVVANAEAEHRWLNEHYPNMRVLVQETVQQSGKSYDVVTIRTEAEERKTFYFTIATM